MSRVLEDRVLQASPLAPAHRMVLFWMARMVPDGQTEALVNRAEVGRRLEASPDVVARAVRAGEAIGLCRPRQNGRIAFSAYDRTIDAEPKAPRPAGVAVAPQGPHRPDPDDDEAPVVRVKPRAVVAEFARQWSFRRKATFIIEKRYYVFASESGLTTLEFGDLQRRIAAYLTDPEPFYQQCQYAFSTFCKNVNKFHGSTVRVADGSRYVPDVDATREYMRRQREGR